MVAEEVISTERLVLRLWQEADLSAFAGMNADVRVMEYFPAVKTWEESSQEYHAILDHFAKHGYGLWAVSEKGKENFIGFIGLNHVGFSAHFTPAVEIGWRLIPEYWGKGYATEGARAVLHYGFDTLNLPEIVSFTAVQNLRSRAVMERIGMHRNPADDFDHPRLAKGHRLQRHVLYRIANPFTGK